MFLALWYYLHGYVMISVTGFSVERFVNLAAYKGIYIWDISPQGPGVTMKVSISGFRMLKECARKTGCHYKIVKKRGLPFCLHKYHKRKMLAAGALLFVIGLYILSSFVWIVDVEGNERIEKQALLNACDNLGLKPGVFKKTIDTKEITEKLMESFGDISWVSVSIQGTNARVKIVETIKRTEIVDRQTPTDLIAQKDGVIISIAVSAGTPMVKANDVVKKGDLLVAAEVILKDGEEERGREYVKAKAAVKAKLWYTIEKEIDLEYIEKQYTGEFKEDTSIVVRDTVLNFLKPNIKYEEFEQKQLYEKPFAIGDYKFPIALRKERYEEYMSAKKTHAPEEAKEMLNTQIEEEMEKIIQPDSEILDSNTQFTQTDNKMTAKAIITVIEHIEQERKIENWSEPIDDTDGEDSTD